MKVRAARPGDLDAMLAIENLAFDAPRRASRASLERSMSSARQAVWVAGAPVQGFAIVWLHPRTHRLYDIAVHPAAQGQGIGDMLLARLESEARRSGVARVVLEADPRVRNLVGWYERRGYRTTARRADFYAPGHEAVRMEKRLAPQ